MTRGQLCNQWHEISPYIVQAIPRPKLAQRLAFNLGDSRLAMGEIGLQRDLPALPGPGAITKILHDKRQEPGRHLLARGDHGVIFTGIVDQIGLYHMAWELADMDQLKDAFQVVLDNNVVIAGFGDHGVTKGLYIRDPDGIEIELYVLAPEFENTPLQEMLTGGTLQGTSAD